MNTDDIFEKAWALRREFRESQAVFTIAEYREKLAAALPDADAGLLDRVADQIDQASLRHEPDDEWHLKGEQELDQGRRIATPHAMLEHMEESLALSKRRAEEADAAYQEARRNPSLPSAIMQPYQKWHDQHQRTGSIPARVMIREGGNDRWYDLADADADTLWKIMDYHCDSCSRRMKRYHRTPSEQLAQQIAGSMVVIDVTSWLLERSEQGGSDE
jgi:hypothetical protein